jgi:hypothetical protein
MVHLHHFEVEPISINLCSVRLVLADRHGFLNRNSLAVAPFRALPLLLARKLCNLIRRIDMLKRIHAIGLVAAAAACSSAPNEKIPVEPVGTSGLALDCSSFDSYRAALASYTVDCLGTIGPQSYSIDRQGRLQRGFDHCIQDEGKRQSIDDLLGLQYREALFPHATECIAGRWAEWRAKFDQSGILECPQWRKDEVINAPNRENIEHIARRLPKISLQDGKARIAAPPAGVVGETKGLGSEQNYLFTTFFHGSAPVQSCDTPAACAAQCAGGFPSFVLEGEGSKVLGDPTYWLDSGIYDDIDSDPYSGETDGYFHPMSFYGPIPGAIAGHRDRALLEEPCSYYLEGEHFGTRLALDCLNADYESCISICLPP